MSRLVNSPTFVNNVSVQHPVWLGHIPQCTGGICPPPCFLWRFLRCWEKKSGKSFFKPVPSQIVSVHLYTHTHQKMRGRRRRSHQLLFWLPQSNFLDTKKLTGTEWLFHTKCQTSKEPLRTIILRKTCLEKHLKGLPGLGSNGGGVKYGPCMPPLSLCPSPIINMSGRARAKVSIEIRRACSVRCNLLFPAKETGQALGTTRAILLLSRLGRGP